MTRYEIIRDTSILIVIASRLLDDRCICLSVDFVYFSFGLHSCKDLQIVKVCTDCDTGFFVLLVSTHLESARVLHC